MNRAVVAFISSLNILTASPLASADGETRSVITTREMPANPDEALAAFVDEGDLAAWWKVTRSLVEPENGGVWSIAWDQWGAEGTHHSWTGVIEEIAPDRLVISRMVMVEPDMPLLGPMRLEIAVEPTAGGSRLTVTHSGYGYGGHWDKMYDLVVNGWDHVLGDMEEWFKEDY